MESRWLVVSVLICSPAEIGKITLLYGQAERALNEATDAVELEIASC